MVLYGYTPPPAPTPLERWNGHRRTLATFVERSLDKSSLPATEPWQVTLEDPTVGEVRLTGRLLRGDSERLVLFVHGLGGSVESGYMRAGLRAAERARASCLLLNLRGADRLGHDFYHAGLDADLHATIASLTEFSRIEIFGYSLGGHVTLTYASGSPDERVKRVAAVGTPLDLAVSAEAFDAPAFNIYRKHVMTSLHEIYTAAFQRRPQGLLPDQARRISRIREWDERIIAPRHGFRGAAQYYERVSVASRLGALKVPSLYVGSPADPMIPVRAVPLPRELGRLSVHWERDAGHLGFSTDFDLGMNAERGLEPQVLAWLAQG